MLQVLEGFRHLCVSVTQVLCALYWSDSGADSSLKVRKVTAPNFQSASLAIWGKWGKCHWVSSSTYKETLGLSLDHLGLLTQPWINRWSQGDRLRYGQFDQRLKTWVVRSRAKKLWSACVNHTVWKQGRRAMLSVTGKRDGQTRATAQPASYHFLNSKCYPGAQSKLFFSQWHCSWGAKWTLEALILPSAASALPSS